MKKRKWVKEHINNRFHYYGSGHYAHAACGHPPIAGSPICCHKSDLSDGNELLCCKECLELYKIRNCCQ